MSPGPTFASHRFAFNHYHSPASPNTIPSRSISKDGWSRPAVGQFLKDRREPESGELEEMHRSEDSSAPPTMAASMIHSVSSEQRCRVHKRCCARSGKPKNSPHKPISVTDETAGRAIKPPPEAWYHLWLCAGGDFFFYGLFRVGCQVQDFLYCGHILDKDPRIITSCKVTAASPEFCENQYCYTFPRDVGFQNPGFLNCLACQPHSDLVESVMVLKSCGGIPISFRETSIFWNAPTLQYVFSETRGAD